MTDKFDLIINIMNEFKDAVNHRLNAIDNNLDIHMKRSDELEKSNELLNKHFNERVAKLEEPQKAVSLLWKWLLGSGSVAALLFTILKIYELVKHAA